MVMTHYFLSNLGLESMEMGQAMVASRVSGRLLSDFPGMTSLFGGVHACAGSSVPYRCLCWAGGRLLNTELLPVYAALRKGCLVQAARRRQLEDGCVEPLVHQPRGPILLTMVFFHDFKESLLAHEFHFCDHQISVRLYIRVYLCMPKFPCEGRCGGVHLYSQLLRGRGKAKQSWL